MVIPAYIGSLSLILLAFVVVLNVHGSLPMKHVATTNDGIHVRARIDESVGQGETLATGLIKAPINRVWSVLIALDKYRDYMPYMRESRVVKRNSKHVWQYCRTDTPVVSDRDYTLRFTLTKGERNLPFKKPQTLSLYKR